MLARFVLMALIALSFSPTSANAILSQTDALLNSGPVEVKVDIEIGEGLKLLPEDLIRSNAETHLEAAGIPVLRDNDQGLPAVIAPAERVPAEIWVSLAARRITEPPGYIVDVQVSHFQFSVLQRMRTVAIKGLDWQESWAFIAPDDTDILKATNNAVEPLLNDFAKAYMTANQQQQ